MGRQSDSGSSGHRAAHRDPRIYQIAVLSTLLVYGVLALDLEVSAPTALAILTAALLTQGLFSKMLGLRPDLRSPLISGLSLCLLLRTPSVGLAALAAAIAIGSKFLIRRHGKHVFNPSALALVVLVPASDRAWVSAGQWGSVAFFGFLVAGCGMFVVHRAARADVTLAFLGWWGAIVFGRAWWLGDPLAIPLHQMQSGALLLFAFFMISDPKTTPDSRAGRVFFAGLVALGAGLVQFGLYRANGPLYALVALAPLVPLIDRLMPAARYRWSAVRGGRVPTVAGARLPGRVPALVGAAPSPDSRTLGETTMPRASDRWPLHFIPIRKRTTSGRPLHDGAAPERSS